MTELRKRELVAEELQTKEGVPVSRETGAADEKELRDDDEVEIIIKNNKKR